MWVGQDKKDDPVAIKNTFKSTSTINLSGHGVNKHKGEDFAQRTVRKPYLKWYSGEHNSASIKPAQALEMLESGVWDLPMGDGKRYFSGTWNNATEQASKLSHHLPPRATGIWQLVQALLISGRSSTDHAVLPLLSSAVPNCRPYLCSSWRIWHPRSTLERIVRTWTRWCGAGSCGTGRSLHHSLQKSDLGLSCHCSHIFYKCFQLAKGSHSNQGHTWKEEQHCQWRTVTFLPTYLFLSDLFYVTRNWSLSAASNGQRAN